MNIGLTPLIRLKKRFKRNRILTQRYVYAKFGAFIHRLGVSAMVLAAGFVKKIGA